MQLPLVPLPASWASIKLYQDIVWEGDYGHTVWRTLGDFNGYLLPWYIATILLGMSFIVFAQSRGYLRVGYGIFAYGIGLLIFGFYLIALTLAALALALALCILGIAIIIAVLIVVGIPYGLYKTIRRIPEAL